MARTVARTVAAAAAFEARSPRQQQCMRLLLAEAPAIAIVTGPAGCGKTRLAVEAGLALLQSRKVDRIVVTRPAVAAGEDLGFLPGTLEDKLRPWLLPVTDALARAPRADVEFASIAHMRGRTFDRAFVICDEAQNCTREQLLMLMTRVGCESKMVLTGDPEQSDLGAGDASVLARVARAARLDASASIEAFEFDEADVQRHPVVRDVLRMFRGGVP
jgi:phosphate starvation-inducible PhoH-like protein